MRENVTNLGEKNHKFMWKKSRIFSEIVKPNNSEKYVKFLYKKVTNLHEGSHKFMRNKT